ncbi:unnamed protein product [Lymnaea stagnalis]|uniref:Ig-like domain-containing protein n=1 Tax=Lymnaea stagnalis TaxID=6523 RepID=A0AAV2HMI6_LYMST
MLHLLAPVLAFFTTQTLCQMSANKAGYPQQNAHTPHISEVSKSVIVVSGQTAVLPCSVDYLGVYKVVWVSGKKTLTFEDRRIVSDERISLERPYVKEWNLHIRKVEPSDSGKYQCQINTDPIQVRNVTLVVHEPPRIIEQLSSPPTVSVREWETVELVCNVTGIPTPRVSWYRVSSGLMDGDDAGAKKLIGNEGEVLVIHNVSRYCDDKYECLAFNNVDPVATREIRVHVEFPPEVRLPNRKLGQTKGKSTILECEITAYPQILSVWKRNGKELQRGMNHVIEVYNEGNKVILSLRIQSVQDEDFGEYECYAHNLLGDDSEKMLLHETPKPEPKTSTTTTIKPTWQQNVDQRHGHHHSNNGENQIRGVGLDGAEPTKSLHYQKGDKEGSRVSSQRQTGDQARGYETSKKSHDNHNQMGAESKSSISDDIRNNNGCDLVTPSTVFIVLPITVLFQTFGCR